jgi:methyl-accepting chemotaxis protein
LVRIGDGDILLVRYDGETESVLPKDPELIGTETTSLSQSDALHKFKVKVIDRNTKPEVIMVLLSSDGYNNSYESDVEFLSIGKDYLQLVQKFGLENTIDLLPKFLNETSEGGSGDDITLGIMKKAEWNERDAYEEHDLTIRDLKQSSTRTNRQLIQLNNSLNNLASNVKEIQSDLENTQQLNIDIERLDRNFDAIRKEYQKLNRRFPNLNQELKQIGDEVTKLLEATAQSKDIQNKLNEILMDHDTELNQIKEQFGDLDNRVKSISERSNQNIISIKDIVTKNHNESERLWSEIDKLIIKINKLPGEIVDIVTLKLEERRKRRGFFGLIQKKLGLQPKK